MDDERSRKAELEDGVEGVTADAVRSSGVRKEPMLERQERNDSTDAPVFRREPLVGTRLLMRTAEIESALPSPSPLLEVARAYVTALSEVFRDHDFVARLIPERAHDPLRVCASGILPDDTPLRLALSQVAVDRCDHELPTDEGAAPRITPSYEPILVGSTSGVDVALCCRGQFYGVLSAEQKASNQDAAAVSELLWPVAVHLGARLHDHEQRRHAEVSAARLAEAIDTVHAPMAVIGRDRILQLVNPALAALIGRPVDAMEGRDFLELLPDEDRSRALPMMVRALRGEAIRGFNVGLTTPRARTPRVVFDADPIRGVDGEVEAVVAVGRDITELRRLEAQVIQAEKLATLGELAAGVVHELNNPLTSISIYADFLLRKGKERGYEAADLEKLGRIAEASDRILEFTRDLVTYARPSSEGPNFVNVRETLDQSLIFCDHVIADSQAEVSRDYSDAVKNVYGVKGQLHQVFINLITNACHSLTEPGGLLVVRSRLEDSWVRIEIEDEGSGIPAADREYIFEPFFSTKREGHGTGLGLSIVQKIVQQHDGTIDIEDREVVGTRVIVRLPLPSTQN